VQPASKRSAMIEPSKKIVFVGCITIPLRQRFFKFLAVYSSFGVFMVTLTFPDGSKEEFKKGITG
jgi:hypothetical protein